MHHRSSVKPRSKLYVPRGSARLGEEGEAAPAAPTKAEDPIESSGLDAKIAQLEASGFTVAERLPMAPPSNEHNHAYIETKRSRAGHMTD